MSHKLLEGFETVCKVEIVVDSFKSEIVSCKCYECVAALGGCKHQLALLGCMHRRTEDKTPTEN